MDNGIFSHKTAADLFAKLKRDHISLKEKPTDSDVWFNFVVTADHIPEWYHGANESKANDMRRQETALRIANHLSRSAKHYTPKGPRYSVTQTNVSSTQLIGGKPPVEEFGLELEPRESAELGRSQIKALGLAEMVIQLWAKELNLPPT